MDGRKREEALLSRCVGSGLELIGLVVCESEEGHHQHSLALWPLAECIVELTTRFKESGLLQRSKPWNVGAEFELD